MMLKFFLIFLLLFAPFAPTFAQAKNQVFLSRSVYSQVPYSSIYKQQGALVRNINFEPVNELNEQLKTVFGMPLQSRGEAHITVITPPDFSGALNGGQGLHEFFSTDEIHSAFKDQIQTTNFKILCVGGAHSLDGKTVFYLVVDSPDLFEIRKTLQTEYERRAQLAGKVAHFDYSNFYPHITIGYIKDDIHGISKGQETCLKDIEIAWTPN
jgi:hypothetical protein